MKKIGLISDTHSHLEEKVFEHFADCDEIWHAGDIGTLELADRLAAFKPFKAVYGNIDGSPIRQEYPLDLRFDCEGMDVWMTHIGGYPGRYRQRVRELMKVDPPDLFICGHSHILKVMPDKKNKLLHINPGAAGVHGFHQVKTIIRFVIDRGQVKDLEVVEMGRRGALS